MKIMPFFIRKADKTDRFESIVLKTDLILNVEIELYVNIEPGRRPIRTNNQEKC